MEETIVTCSSYPSIFKRDVKVNHGILEDDQCPTQISNLGPPEY
jgi:hypothetical protein